jgi:hypothetical protein
VNEAKLEQIALDHVLQSCDTSCTESFRKQVQDRIALIEAEKKWYQAVQDDPARLREYVNECRACSFREEALAEPKPFEQQQAYKTHFADPGKPASAFLRQR